MPGERQKATTKTTSKVGISPKTGDNFNLALWIGIALASTAGLGGTAFLLIRNWRKKILY